MAKLKIDTSKAVSFVPGAEQLEQKALDANSLLHSKDGQGSDFLGWVDLPSSTSVQLINDIKACANTLRDKAEIVVCIGIGGSYLGAKAVLEAMSNNFECLRKEHDYPTVIFAGQNLSQDYIYELMQAIKDRSIAAIVISKSGTTTEPAIAFRIIKSELESRYGKREASERIIAITDEKRGALKTLSQREGYKTFVIPDNVGGRFSVLTPVGLVPLAVAGVDIEALIEGARDMERQTAVSVPFGDNPAAIYAVMRNALYTKGYKIEILASYEPKLQNIAEWWKQLYGESEGKQGRGIFPASVSFTADLHSMGQYIQQGERTLFETVLSVKESRYKFTVEQDPDNLDDLNFLAGKSLAEVNSKAELGVMIAHIEGGVPNIRIEIPIIDEYHIGALLYFFEKACGISGYMLGVNPFDQPGVEAYKKNMFALLGKPGYEKESAEILKKL